MTLAPPLYAELASYFLPRALYLEAIDLDVHKLLHIRSFLDHNRPYVRLASYAAGSRTPQTSGAFAYLGDKIPPDELGDNLVRHLRRWAPYLRALRPAGARAPYPAARADRCPSRSHRGGRLRRHPRVL